MTRRRTNSRKRIHRNSLIGQEGINLIEEVLLKMGYLWVPAGAIEAGIDGTIEIRDPVTGDLLQSIIRVQSKATSGPFVGQSGTTFDYTCDERDLQYWLAGNVPVILIRSRTDTREAYWVSVKDYFRDPARRTTRKVTFDTTRDRFDPSAAKALRDLAVPKDSGLYFVPPPKPETLTSNLLRVASLPARLYHAVTECGSREAVREVFRAKSRFAPREFVAHGRTILSVHDLSAPTWVDIADPGTVEEFPTSEWSESVDDERRRAFVELLNQCLAERLNRAHVRYHERRDFYYFERTPDLRPRLVRYQGGKQSARKEVFGSRASKLDPARVAYYRHSAFIGHFVRHDEVWYLEVVPTYHFTADGYRTDRHRADRLTGIKRLERNSSVLGQLRMWAAVLTPYTTLFEDDYPHLRFGQLECFGLQCGVDDVAWLKHEEEPLPSDEEVERADSLFGER